jgi:nucleoside-diphosphate-sugar epimerase
MRAGQCSTCLVPERRAREAARVAVAKTFASLKTLFRSDCDCAVLFCSGHHPGRVRVRQDDGTALCTVTHAEDFAKAFVGLCGNPAAFGEAYHITSDECYTWNRVAEMVGEALGRQPNLCHVPAHDLGFELGGDFGEKLISFSRNGVYDSSKIRGAVPEFVCTTHFPEGVRRTIQFYTDHPEFQVVDEAFDRKMDEIAEKHHAQAI